MSVVDRMLIRIPLSDGKSDGKSTTDGCELIMVELKESGITPDGVEFVIGTFGLDKLKN